MVASDRTSSKHARRKRRREPDPAARALGLRRWADKSPEEIAAAMAEVRSHRRKAS